MADRVLSIEIGYLLTKVCEIERGKTPRILNSFVIPTPDSMLMDGIVETNSQFVTDFGVEMANRRIKTNKAIFTIASSKIAAREAVIPFVKEKQIQSVVRANLSEYFPVDPSQYMFSHSVIDIIREEVAKEEPKEDAKKADTNGQAAETKAEEETETKNKPTKKAKAEEAAPKQPLGKPTGYKILALAAPKQLIASYERLAKSLNLDVVSIDYNGNSIYQAAKEECKDGVQLIVKIDERNSLIMIIDNGAIALNRTIPYGIDEAISTLQETKSLGEVKTYSDALDLARRKTCILNSFDIANAATANSGQSDSDDSVQVREDKATVTNSLRTLAGGIMRVIEYYNANHGSRPIEKAYLTGIGADFSGLSALLTIEFGFKVKNLVHLAGINIEKVFKDVTYGEYVTVIGASIAPIRFYADHDEEGKGKSSSKSGVSGMFVAILVAALGVIASIIMIVMSLVPYTKELANNLKYKKTITALTPAYETYEKFLKVKADIEYLRNVDRAGLNRNNEFNEFLSFLETEMPYSFCVTSIDTDYESMTMEATVGSKEEVAYALSKLKNYEMFLSADITGVSWIENELGEIVYSFTVDMMYMPYPDPNETEEEVTEE